jgi:hypothetical protein
MYFFYPFLVSSHPKLKPIKPAKFRPNPFSKIFENAPKRIKIQQQQETADPLDATEAQEIVEISTVPNQMKAKPEPALLAECIS